MGTLLVPHIARDASQSQRPETFSHGFCNMIIPLFMCIYFLSIHSVFTATQITSLSRSLFWPSMY